jgi:hypothetical protein
MPAHSIGENPGVGPKLRADGWVFGRNGPVEKVIIGEPHRVSAPRAPMNG